MQSAIRSVGATLLVGLWAAFRRESLIERDGTLWWGIATGLLFTFEFLLIYWGLEFTHASRAVIFLYLAPFVVAIGNTNVHSKRKAGGPLSLWVLAWLLLESPSPLVNLSRFLRGRC